MKKSILSVIFLAGFFVFANAPLNTVLAQEKTGGVEIKDVKITTKDDKIEISAVLFNPSQNIETSPFIYLLALSSINQLFNFKKSAITPLFLLVSAEEGTEYFVLKPKEEKAVSFFLPINPYLPKNNYTLSLAMVLPTGESLDLRSKVIYDLGFNQKIGDFYKDGFLTFDQERCVIITPTGKEFGNNDGPIFKPSEAPKIRCAVKNVGKEEITVFSNIEWKEFFVYGRPASGKKAVEKLDKAIIFKPGEIKTIELSLPAAERPQVYQALLSFVDKDNVARSYNMPFRWTIGGPSARVERVVLTSSLRSVYEKGETISLSVDYFGSMDLFWGGISEDKVSALTEVKTSAVIKDKKGAVCGRKEATLPDVYDAGLQNKIIDIALDKKCEGVSYNVSLLSEGENLAELSGFLPNMIIENQAEEKSRAIPLSYYIIGAFILVAAYKIVIAINRKRHKNDWQKNLILFLFVAGAVGFFLGGFDVAEAARIQTLTVQNVSDDGVGDGIVTSDNPTIGGINCGTGSTGDCVEVYGGSARVILNAIPNAVSAVYSWTGGGSECPLRSDIATCKTTMGDDRTVRAFFRRTYALNIGGASSGRPNLLPPAYADGSGTVEELNVGGINCIISGSVTPLGDCSENYASGSTLRVFPRINDDNNIFAGWTGNCAADNYGCFFPAINGNKNVNAVFYKTDTLRRSLASKLKEDISVIQNSFNGMSPFYVPTSSQVLFEMSIFFIKEVTTDLSSSVNQTDVIFSYISSAGSSVFVYPRVKMAVSADALPEQFVNFGIKGTGLYDFSHIFNVSDGAMAGFVSDKTMLYEIKPEDLALLSGKTNPYLILYFTAATKPFGTSAIYYRRGVLDFSYTNPYDFDIDIDKFDIGSTRPPPSNATVFDASDVIKIKIPITIPPPNNPPVLGSIGNKATNEGQLLSFTVLANDPDGDTLTYSAAPLSPGATINSSTGVFNWTPTFSQSRTYNVRFTVNDGKGGTDFEDITITVNNINRSPDIGTVGPQHTLDITPPATSHSHSGATASDPDGDPMTYSWSWASASPCPGILPCPSLTSNTGSVISGLINGPAYIPDEAGTYNIQLSVSDGTITATAPLAEITNTIPVADAGSPPHTLTVGVSHTHSGATASDPDGAGSDLAKYKWDWISCPPPSCPPLSNPAAGAEVLIDGSSASAGDPAYTPTVAGDYILKLTVTDDMGAVGEAILTENATLVPPPPPTTSNWWDLFNNIWKEQK